MSTAERVDEASTTSRGPDVPSLDDAAMAEAVLDLRALITAGGCYRSWVAGPVGLGTTESGVAARLRRVAGWFS